MDWAPAVGTKRQTNPIPKTPGGAPEWESSRNESHTRVPPGTALAKEVGVAPADGRVWLKCFRQYQGSGHPLGEWCCWVQARILSGSGGWH